MKDLKELMKMYNKLLAENSGILPLNDIPEGFKEPFWNLVQNNFFPEFIIFKDYSSTQNVFIKDKDEWLLYSLTTNQFDNRMHINNTLPFLDEEHYTERRKLIDDATVRIGEPTLDYFYEHTYFKAFQEGTFKVKLDHMVERYEIWDFCRSNFRTLRTIGRDKIFPYKCRKPNRGENVRPSLLIEDYV